MHDRTRSQGADAPSRDSNRPGFDRTLFIYALAGGAVTSVASAGVVSETAGGYGWTLQAGPNGSPSSLSFNFGAAIPLANLTFRYEAHNGASGGSLKAGVSDQTVVQLSDVGTEGDVASFNVGDVIDGSDRWYNGSANKTLAEYQAATGLLDPNNSTFAEGQSAVAFRIKKDGENWNYGYLWVTVAASDSTRFQVNGWAYEEGVGSITVEALGGGAAVPGPMGLAAFAAGACGLRSRRKRSLVA